MSSADKRRTGPASPWVAPKRFGRGEGCLIATPIPVTALVQEVPQYLPAGYDSQAQFGEWHGYICELATITAILQAYGAKTRISILFDLLYERQFGILDIAALGASDLAALRLGR
jgi:hypothetical protein